MLKDLTKQYDKSENDLKALQSVGQVSKLNWFFNSKLTEFIGWLTHLQIVGEVLKQLTEEKCNVSSV